MSTWRTRLAKHADELEWHDPASEQIIVQTEDVLHLHLPSSLKSFLLESDGLFWKPPYLNVVWSAESIAKENLRLRSDSRLEDHMTLEWLLFFSSAGVDGIRFAFPITRIGHVRENIIAWYPMEDSRPIIAASLADYLERWLDGTLTV